MADQPAVVQVAVPLMTREKFAELSGLTEGVVRGMCDKGHLPVVKIGKYGLINVAMLTNEALQEGWEK